MCMTYYTVDDLRPGRPGWDVRQFSALAEAIDHYRTLPMNGVRVLGMADDAHAYGEIGVGLARGIDKDGFDCWYCVQVFLLDGCEVTWVDTPASK